MKDISIMASNSKPNKKEAYSKKQIDDDQLAKYAKASYFKEKDKKAAAFLKKHPVPEKFLK
jgi:hypothetical protein